MHWILKSVVELARKILKNNVPDVFNISSDVIIDALIGLPKIYENIKLIYTNLY